MDKKQTQRGCTVRGAARAVAVGLAFLAAPVSWAAEADIANIPLTTAAATVKPNVLFILDDSGSMSRNFMPEEANFDRSKYGWHAAQCNGLAYNPSAAYLPPLDAAGAVLATGSFTFPRATDLDDVRTITVPTLPSIATGSISVTVPDGNPGSYPVGMVVTLFSNDDQALRMVGTVTGWDYASKVLTVNVAETQGTGSLASPRVADGDNRPFYFTYAATGSLSQPALGYTYDTNGVITSTTFYQQCDATIGSLPSVFTPVVVTPFNINDNYRNWYTYYRTRMLMAKSATSRAFGPITGDRFRVGFTTISSRYVDGDKFLDVRDFDSTHKGDFYTKLNAATTGGTTPLRGALSKAGKYYAKKGRRTDGTEQGDDQDPIQLSCQKNFAILTTDGYWNTGSEVSGTGNNSYGPDRLDNTDVGNQDGDAPRMPHPMRDGGASIVQERTNSLQQRSVTPQWTTSTSTLQQQTITPGTISTSNLQRRTLALFEERSSNRGVTWGPLTPVTSCEWDTNGDNRVRCSYDSAGWSAWSNVASCTSNAPDTGTSNGTDWATGVECQYTAWSAPVATASCTPRARDNTSPHNVDVAVACVAPVYGTWTNASSCTSSATMGCRYTGPVNTTTASCTAIAPSPGPSYTVATAVTCTARTPLYGTWTNASSCTVSASADCRYVGWTGWTNISSCTAEAPSSAPTYTVGTARECQTVTSGGTSNTLADVAMYYYNTDLRTTDLGNCVLTNGTNVCTNNVSATGNDNAQHQHMTTFTIGMGVSGVLGYSPGYLRGSSPDYERLKEGSLDWPVPVEASAVDAPPNIDDLWHAAVNGRGQYFNAGNPEVLADSLSAALSAINAANGSGSGAAASTLQPVSGDNSLFIAMYRTVDWTGDVVSRSINPVTGVIGSSGWSAQAVLQARVNSGTTPRVIYYMRRNASANTGTLVPFTYGNLDTDNLEGYFNNACTKAVPLSQCADAGFDTASANTGANLVDWLIGNSTHNALYRTRAAVLGDIVGGAPVYVKRPPFQYTENDYASFVAARSTRDGVVYAAANDGMLHAFDADDGTEKWAYVPTMVMDRMYRLADQQYADRHQYLVNGAPVIGDIWVPPPTGSPAGTPGTWKTILVGGLGAGGRGYYALDITDPENPQALWEFTNDSYGGANNLGLSFGNPVITKRSNAAGTWVVAFTSGYNNTNDGLGRLFVVDANTGTRLVTLATTEGTAETPSGLGKLNAWVDSTIDNTARRFYAGDLLGNLWRFDIDGLVAPNNAAHRLAILSGGSPARAQPITTQPALGLVDYAGSQYPAVFVGTGRLIGEPDITDTSVQSVYGIKDPLDATSLGDVRSPAANLVAQTLTLVAGTGARNATTRAVDWSTRNGWYVDLIGSGERVNVDMLVVFNTLTVATNVPNTGGSCDGRSFLYQFEVGTGSSSDGLSVGVDLGATLVVGMNYLMLGDKAIAVTVDNQGTPGTHEVRKPPPPPPGGRRTSWRELVN